MVSAPPRCGVRGQHPRPYAQRVSLTQRWLRPLPLSSQLWVPPLSRLHFSCVRTTLPVCPGRLSSWNSHRDFGCVQCFIRSHVSTGHLSRVAVFSLCSRFLGPPFLCVFSRGSVLLGGDTSSELPEPAASGPAASDLDAPPPAGGPALLMESVGSHQCCWLEQRHSAGGLLLSRGPPPSNGQWEQTPQGFAGQKGGPPLQVYCLGMKQRARLF